MARTTFSGPVGSKNGFEVVNENGVNETQILNSVKDSKRQYLNEVFLQRVGMNSDIASDSLNKNFELVNNGSGNDPMTNFSCKFPKNGVGTGIVIQSFDSAGDNVVIAPHLDTLGDGEEQSQWSGIEFGTDNEVEWECSISLPVGSNNSAKHWAGLKLTNVSTISTDSTQAFFKYQKSAINGETFSDFTKLHFVYSVSGTDYISQLPIDLSENGSASEPNGPYHLRIKIDAERKISIFVNGIQYNVTTTAVNAPTGTPVTAGTGKSLALADNVNLIPYIGCETEQNVNTSLAIQYQSISKTGGEQYEKPTPITPT
jgi:hypothetical protein